MKARKGKKQKFVEWDTGIAIYYPITTDSKKSVGTDWHVALDFDAELEGLSGSNVHMGLV